MEEGRSSGVSEREGGEQAYRTRIIPKHKQRWEQCTVRLEWGWCVLCSVSCGRGECPKNLVREEKQ